MLTFVQRSFKDELVISSIKHRMNTLYISSGMDILRLDCTCMGLHHFLSTIYLMDSNFSAFDSGTQGRQLSALDTSLDQTPMFLNSTRA